MNTGNVTTDFQVREEWACTKMQRKFQSRYLASDIPADATKAVVKVWKSGGQRKTHNHLEVKLNWIKDCTSQPSLQKGLVMWLDAGQWDFSRNCVKFIKVSLNGASLSLPLPLFCGGMWTCWQELSCWTMSSPGMQAAEGRTVSQWPLQFHTGLGTPIQTFVWERNIVLSSFLFFCHV